MITWLLFFVTLYAMDGIRAYLLLLAILGPSFETNSKEPKNIKLRMTKIQDQNCNQSFHVYSVDMLRTSGASRRDLLATAIIMGLDGQEGRIGVISVHQT